MVAKLDLVTRHRAGPSGRLRLPRARRRRRRPVPFAARNAQGAARRPRDRAAHRHRQARPARRRDRRRAGAREPAPSSAACYEERGIWFVVAENRRINQDLLVPPDERGNAKAGDVVVVEIVAQPSPQREAARARDRGARQRTPIRAWKSRSRCASTTCRTSSRRRRGSRRRSCRRRCREPTAPGRVDLRALPLVTIDGETAKDFDDAVWCERKGKGFRLVVAIADVSHYVRDGDALDRDARERGTSVYFPRRVIPMLPGGAVERALLAQARGRPAVHGLRHGHHARRARSSSTASTRR